MNPIYTNNNNDITVADVSKHKNDYNDDLHVAVALSHLSEAKLLLSNDYSLVNRIDSNGDQPLHIAIRSGCTRMVKLLIQYDAPVGRRNYEGLTPFGVARFYDQKEMVHLLNQYYELDDSYVGTEPEKSRYKRINLESIPSQIVIRKLELEERIRQAVLDWKQIKRHQFATLIQRKIRLYLTKKHEMQFQLEVVHATQIQKAWNQYQHRKRVKAAIQIQSFQRMVMVKSFFTNFLRERLYWHQVSRILAVLVQRLYRGHKGRSMARRSIEMKSLSNPCEALAFDEWKQHQVISYPPRRSWNIYSEYILSGTPNTWEERRVKRNGYYRDVVFWVNNLTQQASWTQPKKWKQLDRREYEMRQQVLALGYTIDQNETARKLQVLWRAKVGKRNLSIMLKAHKVVKSAIDVYYSDPDNIVALCNFTLHVHVVQQHIQKAMAMYEQCITHMEEKGADNAFILYGFAILRASVAMDFQEYANRAESVERRYRARHETNTSLYRLANEIYKFVVNDSPSLTSWHNYALCRMIAFRDFDGARTAFLRALRHGHESDSTIVLQNFNQLLQDHDKEEDAHDEFRKKKSWD